MSILIKGMKMPTRCAECRLSTVHSFNDRPLCDVLVEYMSYGEWETKRLDNCPLVEVPPHGRLIDADALMQEFDKAQRTMQQHGQEYSCSFMSSSQEISTEWYCVEDMVENAPTIIPVSGGQENE
jgi:hypothetical protein